MHATIRPSSEREHVDDVRVGVAMSMVVPKGRKHLGADALFRLLHAHFATIADDDVDEGEIPLADALMSAFAMWLLLDSRVGDLPRSYHPTSVTLSFWHCFLFNCLLNA